MIDFRNNRFYVMIWGLLHDGDQEQQGQMGYNVHSLVSDLLDSWQSLYSEMQILHDRRCGLSMREMENSYDPVKLFKNT